MWGVTGLRVASHDCTLQVTTPNNLGLDLETSSVAEWSVSMATPFNTETVHESPVVTSSTTSTEEEYECPTTDESILALRYILGDTGKAKVKRLSSRKLPGRGGTVRD